MSSDCDLVCARLIESALTPETLARDPLVAAHVSTCLSCFRVATELRAADELAESLRSELKADEKRVLRAATRAGDPGENFWESLPQQIASAYVHGTAPAKAAPVSPPASSPSLWMRIKSEAFAFLRQPFPAAVTGAALAGVFFYFSRDASTGARNVETPNAANSFHGAPMEPGPIAAASPVTSSAPVPTTEMKPSVAVAPLESWDFDLLVGAETSALDGLLGLAGEETGDRSSAAARPSASAAGSNGEVAKRVDSVLDGAESAELALADAADVLDEMDESALLAFTQSLGH